MPELSRFSSTPRMETATVQVVRLATQQWGAISRQQLQRAGLSQAGIHRWIRQQRLHRLHPGVYVLGHRRLPVEGRCFAALLHAGAGSALSHTTAAWWWGLLDAVPTVIHVSAPGGAASTRGVRVHHPRVPQRTTHRGMPVTPVARTLRDVAFLLPATGTRRAVYEADYKRLLDLAAAQRALGRGRPGAAALRRELERFDPSLGQTCSPLEDEFLELCELHGLPLPVLNSRVGDFTVDALWANQRLAVELDGGHSHGTAAAVAADRARDLYLRDAGYRVLRYSWPQVMNEPERVVADLRRHLAAAN
jgi:hypothetical protein